MIRKLLIKLWWALPPSIAKYSIVYEYHYFYIFNKKIIIEKYV